MKVDKINPKKELISKEIIIKILLHIRFVITIVMQRIKSTLLTSTFYCIKNDNSMYQKYYP